MFLYKLLDYPKVPSELLTQFVPGEKIGEYPSRLCSDGNTTFNTSAGVWFYADNAINSWVKANIDVDIDKVGVRYQYATDNMSRHGVHSDATRDYALIYVAEPGGSESELVFWQQEKQPLETESVVLISDYSSIKPFEVIKIPQGSWYIVNGRVLHSVEKITSTRVTLQVNLKSLKNVL